MSDGSATKRVVLRATFEYTAEVPTDWTAANAEFHYNDSSSCADNVLRDVERSKERRAKKGECMCFRVDVKYARDATDEDLVADGLKEDLDDEPRYTPDSEEEAE